MRALAWIVTTVAVVGAAGCGPKAVIDKRPLPTSEPTTPTPVVPAPPPVAVEPPPRGRLGDNVRPVSYALEVHLDPDRPQFTGTVRIDIELRGAASSVWLHGRKLTIRRAHLVVAGKRTPLTSLAAPKDSELLGFGFGRTVTAKRAQLDIAFTGTYGSTTGAFRQQRYGRWYAFTDFEPIDARAAFPCFDDPRFKVPWSVSLVVPKTLHGFSNAPQVEQRQHGVDHKRLVFATTPPLPSYLVAYAAGPFTIIDGAKRPVPQRIIAFDDSAAKSKLALAAMPVMLDYLERYFGDKVPYRKVDLIAVPRFNGAMENPGLITVAERLLLPDPKTADGDLRLLSLIVVAHELAHLWFGDLVTMDYWNDLWMNEAFATWMSGKLVAAFRPALARKRWEIGDRDSAMRVDETLATPPVRRPIRNRDDIRGAFNAITYRKGAAILTMFEAWVGEAKFRDGLRRYVNARKHGTGTAAHLLSALNKATGRDIATPMRTFLDQSGIPLVSTALSCDGNAATLRLSQSRYLPLGPAARATTKHKSTRWRIPVCVRTGTASGDRGVTCTLLDRRQVSVTLDHCPTWIYPNADANGYYRFRMPVTGLARAAARGTLPPRERLDLAFNVDAMIRSGELPIAAALGAIRTIADTGDRRDLDVVTKTTALLARAAVGPRTRNRFAAWIRATFGKRARALGVSPRPGDSDNDELLRPGLVSLVAIHGADRTLRRQAKRVFDKWVTQGPVPRVHVATPIARMAGPALTKRDIARTDKALREATRITRRRVLIEGLVTATDRKRLDAMLDLALARTPLGVNEGLHIVRRLLAHPPVRDAAWRALRKRSAVLAARTPARFHHYLPLLARGLCTTAQVAEVRTFFDNLLRASSDFTEKAARSVGDCARLGDVYRDPLRRHLGRR